MKKYDVLCVRSGKGKRTMSCGGDPREIRKMKKYDVMCVRSGKGKRTMACV